MRAALTVWNGRVSPVFDVSREILILSIERGTVTARRRESIDAPAPALRIERIIQLGIEVLVCGAISEPLRWELGTRGVRVLGFVAGDIDAVVQALLAGTLPSPALSMPGCYGRRRRLRGGRGCGQRNGWGAQGRR